MRMRFTVTAKNPQRIDVDPAEFVGMSESDMWGRIIDRLFEAAVFTVETIQNDVDAFEDAWREADRHAPKCGICHQPFTLNDQVVLGKDLETKVHFRCPDRTDFDKPES